MKKGDRYKNSLTRKESLVTLAEKIENNLDSNMKASVLNIYRHLPFPIRIKEDSFTKSLYNSDTIKITLRINDEHGEVVT